MFELNLNPGEFTLDDLRRIYQQPVSLSLAPESADAIMASHRVVMNLLASGQTAYGINTGFGLLAQKRISAADLKQLQRNLVLSHACGTGPLMPDNQVRLMLVLKINALAQGCSGVSLSLVQHLLELLHAGIYPCIPSQGSVGASGDLAPLAHMALALMGEGQVRIEGEICDARDALQSRGLKAVELGPKEGLALLNGTQTSTAMALAGLFAAEDLFRSALITGALSVDAALGSDAPFDDRLHAARGHIGQRHVAALYRDLLKGSEIRQSHEHCERVQDPYSLRCQPQVMGACLDNLRHAARVLVTEANAVSDNPLVFSRGPDEPGEVLSGGNFHAEPVAIVADLMALCVAEIGALSERRTALLIDAHLSQLPPFLVHNGGVNSGFMIAQVTAAALASENKSLAHPACIDSLPTSANQEDHVSMATYAARRLTPMAQNTASILGVELLAACQGIDFRQPLKTSRVLQQVHAAVREQVPFYAEDRYFAPDMERARQLIETGKINQLMSARTSLLG